MYFFDLKIALSGLHPVCNCAIALWSSPKICPKIVGGDRFLGAALTIAANLTIAPVGLSVTRLIEISSLVIERVSPETIERGFACE